MKYNIVLLLLVLFVCKKGVGQRKVFTENFEKEYLMSFKNLEAQPKVYVVRTYATNRKQLVSIGADRSDSVYEAYYYSNPCSEADSGQKGFYARINAYTKGVPDDRELLVMVLDTPLNQQMQHAVSIDVKYHHCCRYRVDSLQVILLEKESDVKLFLKGRRFNGVYKDVSLAAVDNRSWKRLSAVFEAGGAWKYMVIGNVDADKECVITKLKPCNCSDGKKQNWEYSEIFIDDVSIAEDR